MLLNTWTDSKRAFQPHSDNLVNLTKKSCLCLSEDSLLLLAQQQVISWSVTIYSNFCLGINCGYIFIQTDLHHLTRLHKNNVPQGKQDKDTTSSVCKYDHRNLKGAHHAAFNSCALRNTADYCSVIHRYRNGGEISCSTFDNDVSETKLR